MPTQGFTPSSRLRLSRLGGTFVCLLSISFPLLFFLLKKEYTAWALGKKGGWHCVDFYESDGWVSHRIILVVLQQRNSSLKGKNRHWPTQ